MFEIGGAEKENFVTARNLDGLAGENIPLIARISTIADAYDAMTSLRPYRATLTSTQALEELQRCAGSQFDPRLVKMFTQLQVVRDDELEFERLSLEVG